MMMVIVMMIDIPDDKENEDPDFEVNTKARKKALDRITVSIPRNLVSPALASSLDRTKDIIRCQQEDPRQEVDRRTRPQVVIYSAVLFTLTRIFLLQSLNILDQQCFYQKFFSVVLLLFKIFMRYL